MKKIKVIAFFTALCLYLCGCNHDPSAPIVDETTANIVTPDSSSDTVPEETDTSEESTSEKSETLLTMFHKQIQKPKKSLLPQKLNPIRKYIPHGLHRSRPSLLSLLPPQPR